MSLDSIVNLTIKISSKTPSQKGFGTPLILAYHTAWPQRVREYSTADELLTAGFTTQSQVYRDAVALKSQNPAPPTFKVGRRSSAPTQTVKFTVLDATPGTVLAVTVDGVTASYTCDADDNIAGAVTGLTAELTALAGVTATAASPAITVAADTAGELHTFTGISDGLAVEDITTEAGIAADLAAVKAADSDWYALLLDCYSKPHVLAAAAWAEANGIIFQPQTADSGCFDQAVTNDVMSAVKAANYARTGVWYHHEIGTGFAAGLAGQVLPTAPGSATEAFKTVAGVAGSNLKPTQESAILAKNGNYYTPLAGVASTFEGKSGAGEYMDTARFADWLHARIQERCVYVLQSNPKVPYTNAGVDLMRGAILGVLTLGVRVGGLDKDPAPAVAAPQVQDIDVLKRAGRRLPDVNFTGRLAGAIHGLDIAGVVSI